MAVALQNASIISTGCPPSVRAAPTTWRVLAPLGRGLQLWHLLSLDAPTVSMLWAGFLAWSWRLRLPVLAVPLLGLATWILYITDRLLDAARPGAAGLRERHYFHKRHATGFLMMAAAGLVALGLGVSTRLPGVELRDYLWLGVPALGYLLLVHVRLGRLPQLAGWLPKELAVALIFAAATAVPAWSQLRAPRLAFVATAVLFAAACWLNCVAIEVWEGASGVHPLTAWLGARLRPAALGLAGLAIGFLPARPAGAVALAGLAFFLLDTGRARLPQLRLRIAADLALLTPLLLLWR